MRFRKSNPKRDAARIVVCAPDIPQAGDLEALLFKEFNVERVNSIKGLEKSLRSPAQAVIVFLDNCQNFKSCSPQAVHSLHKWQSRVLIVGREESPNWVKDLRQVWFFERVPECHVILEALEGLCVFKGEANLGQFTP